MQDVVKRLEAGENARDIADSLGLKWSTFESRLNRAGIQPRKIKMEAQRERMLHMRNKQHMSNREIAEALGCHIATVQNNIGAGINEAKKRRIESENTSFVVGWKVPSLCRKKT